MAPARPCSSSRRGEIPSASSVRSRRVSRTSTDDARDVRDPLKRGSHKTLSQPCQSGVQLRLAAVAPSRRESRRWQQEPRTRVPDGRDLGSQVGLQCRVRGRELGGLRDGGPELRIGLQDGVVHQDRYAPVIHVDGSDRSAWPCGRRRERGTSRVDVALAVRQPQSHLERGVTDRLCKVASKPAAATRPKLDHEVRHLTVDEVLTQESGREDRGHHHHGELEKWLRVELRASDHRWQKVVAAQDHAER